MDNAMNQQIRMIAKQIADKAELLLKKQESIVIAIDGRCGAGKSTLAKALQEQLLCPVISMDDFFLRKEQRTKERLAEPGSNVDYERFAEEVLLPLKERKSFSYRPYDCKTQSLKEPVFVPVDRITVIEGAYSCHPVLWTSYDLHIFLDVDKKEQIKRIQARNGEDSAKRFEELWIPLEEAYFEGYQTKEKCELYFIWEVDK